ncbi:histone deacetylase HDT1-like protein [Corchorus capsularis]|uniref:Histone deacetylase HDT1-like protein n=1 Tax=Corchorus capsularis TaxID=210143 RepID=A0A1R3GJR8_COCAP|nr:histone deacetylase HDT1-like protein [Corchorus capsularis]
MEFWGLEVKAGKPIKSDPGARYVIHLSQASLGESKTKAESVPIYVTVKGKKLVLGTLAHQSCPQISLDLVFESEFELSHNWKNGSVHFLGYRTYVPPEEEYPFSEVNSFILMTEFLDEESEEELPVVAAENGKAKPDAKTAKANAAVKIEEPNKKTEDEDSDEDESDSDEDESDSDESDSESGDEMSMDDSDESDEDQDTPTPKKVASSKKRPAEAATPVSAKKAKSAATPQKTDGKKGGHTATPHPAKQAGKSSAKSPKSGGQFSCGSCSKSFGSEGGLDSHKKAKHGGK